MTDICRKCGVPLTSDDRGAYRKFRDREATEFLCLKCFSEELGCSEDYLHDRIEFLKRNGCRLFF